MSNRPELPDNKSPEKPDSVVETEALALPPPGVAFVADTGQFPPDADQASTDRYVSDQTRAGRDGSVLFHERRVVRFQSGPFPSPETLRELAEIYPDAPRLIFEDFHAQSAHRREIETSVIATKNSLAKRGQIIGGILGGIGLVGSLVVAGVGQGWAGFGIAESR
jgi:uncharacterized membrane protein